MDSPHDPATPEPTSPPPPTSRRSRRKLLLGLGVFGLAAIIFVLVYFEPQTAFIDDKVNETIPGLDQVQAAEPSTTTAPIVATVTTTAPTVTPAPVTTAPSVTPAPVTTAPSVTPVTVTPVTVTPATVTPVTAAPTTSTLPSTTVPPPPANSISGALALAQSTGAPVIVSSGQFFSGEHSTTGTALVVALPDGSVVVRFEGLDTSNGPDLRVVLSPDEASESWQYSGRLILDELKGNIGDQNYPLNADVDLAGYRSVVIWCERFSVAFGAAPIDVQA